MDAFEAKQTFWVEKSNLAQLQELAISSSYAAIHVLSTCSYQNHHYSYLSMQYICILLSSNFHG